MAQTKDVYVVRFKDGSSLLGIIDQWPQMADEDGQYVDGHVVVRSTDDYGRPAFFAMSIVERIEFVEEATVEFNQDRPPIVTLDSDVKMNEALAALQGEEAR